MKLVVTVLKCNAYERYDLSFDAGSNVSKKNKYLEKSKLSVSSVREMM